MFIEDFHLYCHRVTEQIRSLSAMLEAKNGEMLRWNGDVGGAEAPAVYSNKERV